MKKLIGGGALVLLPLGFHTAYEFSGHSILPGVPEIFVDVVCGLFMLFGLAILIQKTFIRGVR